jgi:transcriptional regulator with XRE-family HTH domain
MKQPELGIKIAEGRIKKNITQKELAELCNIDIRTIQRIEAGEVVPRMYTLKLISAALGFLPGYLNGGAEKNEQLYTRSRQSFIAGIIFSSSCIPAVFYLITRSLPPVIHILSISVFIISCIFFYRGFYLMGRQENNHVLSVSALLSMVLLPLINVSELLRVYLVKNFMPGVIGLAPTLFTLLCINAIVFGVGLLIQSKKRKSSLKNLLQIAGIVTIFQTILFLSLNFTLLGTGLVISIITNLLLCIILYREYKSWESTNLKVSAGSSIAT